MTNTPSPAHADKQPGPDSTTTAGARSLDDTYEPAELASLRVADDYQSRGIGGALLDHAIAQHPGPMELLPSPFGNQALSKGQLPDFYARHGFRDERPLTKRPQ
jgi:GNAT superfamily N-acetyltransferase